MPSILLWMSNIVLINLDASHHFEIHTIASLTYYIYFSLFIYALEKLLYNLYCNSILLIFNPTYTICCFNCNNAIKSISNSQVQWMRRSVETAITNNFKLISLIWCERKFYSFLFYVVLEQSCVASLTSFYTYLLFVNNIIV